MPRDGGIAPRWNALRVTVRHAELRDLFPVLDLARAYHAQSGEAGEIWDDAQAAATISGFIAQRSGFGLVAEKDGSLVGFIGVWIDRKYLVCPQATNDALYAGTGRARPVIGAQLIAAAIVVARDVWKVKRFHFCSASDLPDGGRTMRSLWVMLQKRFGFRPTGPTMTLRTGG